MCSERWRHAWYDARQTRGRLDDECSLHAGLVVAGDQAGEVERAVELLHADAKNGLEYMVARQTEEQAENSEQLLKAGHRLNMLVAIFLPLTALGSAFGMNFRHGLESITSPLLFWGTLFLGLVLGFFVKLLLDEPAAGMNPQEKLDLMGLIRFIRDRFGVGILLIEHDMKLVMSVCERITVLDHCETISVGTPKEVQCCPDVIEAYLGEPVSA